MARTAPGLTCAEVAEALPRDLALLALAYALPSGPRDGAAAFSAAAAAGELVVVRWLAAQLDPAGRAARAAARGVLRRLPAEFR